ncbi:MAG: hypothetical protein WAW90_00585 [Minisyncoccia bacterium]
MISKWFLSLFVIVALALGACATSGGERKSPDNTGMEYIAIVQNPLINGGVLSPEAVELIQKFAKSCSEQLGPQVAGSWQSTAKGALQYGVAGGVGGGGGGSAWTEVSEKIIKYAVQGLWIGGAAGGMHGYLEGNRDMAVMVGTCTKEFWEDIVAKNPPLSGVHVIVVPDGKAWGNNSEPPALLYKPTGSVASATASPAPVAAKSEGDKSPTPPVVKSAGSGQTKSTTSAGKLPDKLTPEQRAKAKAKVPCKPCKEDVKK